MQIVCPHCTTAYDVPGDALSSTGRKVRCARCKETWLALPTIAPAYADNDWPVPDSVYPPAPSDPDEALPEATETAHIDSPPLATELPEDAQDARDGAPSGIVHATQAANVAHSVPPELHAMAEPVNTPLRRRKAARKDMRLGTFLGMVLSVPGIIATLGVLCFGLLIWRDEVVRLMPQTNAFYKTIGLGVNLRAIDFANVTTTTETVNGTTMLTVEGEIVARKQVEVPRLRFSLRDANGAEVHAWTATIEQASLNAGERTSFRSILAAPSPQGREIAVRFFNKRDMSVN